MIVEAIDTRPKAEIALRLRADALLNEGGDEGLQISFSRGIRRLPQMRPGAAAALRALAAADVTETRLAMLVTAQDGDEGLLYLHMMLSRLDRAGLMEHTVALGGVPIARLRPVGDGPVARAPVTDKPVRLSRFAVLQAEDGVLVAQAPRSHLTVELAGPAVALAGRLTGWLTPAELADALPELGERAVREVLVLMESADLLAPGGPDDDVERSRPGPAMWETHDLWLHARARGTRLSAGYGGTYRFRDVFDPLPAVPQSPSHWPDTRIVLPRPDLAAIEAVDPPYAKVQESRRSTRVHDGSRPITAGQLGELLFRTMRHRTAPVMRAGGQETCDRPYPSGGALGELELYPLVTSCAGIRPGLWHYESDAHALRLVSEPSPATGGLLATARAAGVMTADPQVVLIVTARFGRIAWKYESMCYSVILKHVGVLYQTIYLVATAMGLAVCGLGGGDANDFAAASGLGYHDEGSVGEMLIGTPQSPSVLEV